MKDTWGFHMVWSFSIQYNMGMKQKYKNASQYKQRLQQHTFLKLMRLWTQVTRRFKHKTTPPAFLFFIFRQLVRNMALLGVESI